MNVLLVITNINGFHEVPYSFGLGSIASYITSKGHNTKILAIRNREDYDKLIDEARLNKPSVVGFSAVSSQYDFVKDLAKLVKDIDKDIMVVCGGVHPTLYPNAILESDSIDGFFVGESEIAFVDLLDRLEKKMDYSAVNNLAYRDADKVIVNRLNPLIHDLDKLPFPLKDSLFEEFIKTNGFAPFFFSRGCPYSCSYCSNHALAKKYGMATNKPRFRSVDSCIKEIKEAREKYPFNSVWIMDDTFGLDKKWRQEFCKAYKKEINLRFLCLLRVNIVDEKFINLLKAAGCYRIMFGVESGNEWVRNVVMNRNLSNEQISRAFGLCRKHKIETLALNIIGVPGETEEMIWDTIKLNRKIRSDDSGVNIFYPYKGTKLGDACFEKGLVDIDLYSSFSNERRQTVLKYDEQYQQKLYYYRDNWEDLVLPFTTRMKRRLLKMARNSFAWRSLRAVKNNIFCKKEVTHV